MLCGLRVPGWLRMLGANGAMEARGAVEAERSDPGVNRRWRAVSSGSGAMDVLLWTYNLMRMDDGNVD